MIADHRRAKRHHPSGEIATENSGPKVTNAVSSNAKAEECDTDPVRAT